MSRDRTLVMAACYLSMLSVGENSTAIMAALPAMTSGLGFGPPMAEWIVNTSLGSVPSAENRPLRRPPAP